MWGIKLWKRKGLNNPEQRVTASSHSVIMYWMQKLQRVWLITDAWTEQLGHVAASHSSRDKMDDTW